MLTNKTVQENTDNTNSVQSEKVNNLKYSKTKLPWFSCLLQHSASKRGGLILQCPRANTGPKVTRIMCRDCYLTVYRYFTKIVTPAYLLYCS